MPMYLFETMIKKKKQMKTNDEAQFKINKILKGKIKNKKNLMFKDEIEKKTIKNKR